MTQIRKTRIASVLIVASMLVLLVIPAWFTARAAGQEAIIDYKTLITNSEKLAAVERLIQEAHDERNRQSELAATNVTRYSATFYTYIHEYFLPTLQRLLYERNALREAIREGAYSTDAWAKVSQLPDDKLLDVYLELYGNKTLQRITDTIASSSDLIELETVNLDDLKASHGFDPLEDYTTYTEYDEAGDITITDADTITITGADPRDDSFWVYYDKGAAHFNEDFEHRVQCEWTGFASLVVLSVWQLANIVGDGMDVIGASEDGLMGRFYYITNHYINIRESDGGTTYDDGYTDFTTSTRYWLTYERDEGVGTYGTLYCYICDDDGGSGYYDEGGSHHVDTLSIALHSSKKDYRYIYALTSWDTSTSVPSVTGVVEALDLQEPSCPDVATNATDDIEDTTATLNGQVMSINDASIGQRGFAWGTTSKSEPDCATDPSGAGYDSYWTEAGSFGTGVFDHAVTGLATATTHYARAAANNSDGNWGWGDEVSWLTKPAAPTNVAASDGTYTAVTEVTWTASAGNVSGYWLYVDGTPTVDVGDVTAYNYTSGAPTITPGAATASDGTSSLHTTLGVAGEVANNGTTNIYSLTAYNPTGNSTVSANDTGFRGVGSITYQFYESSGVPCSGFSQIGGATTDPYNHTGAPAPTIDGANATASDATSSTHVTLSANETASNGDTRCYLCELSATGAASQNTTTNTGYRGTTTLTYQWWESSGDAASNYTTIAGGTTDPYNHTGGVITPDGRYYLMTTGMAGATSQNSSADRGNKAAVTTPTLTCAAATSISASGATLNGEVTDTGGANITMRGFEWGYSTGNYTGSWNETSADFGLGTFSHAVAGLNNCTAIYYRAFAVNSQGTGNSTECTFNTTGCSEEEAVTPSVVDMSELIDYLEDLLGGPLGIVNVIFAIGLLACAIWKKGWIRVGLSLGVVIWGAFATEYDLKMGLPLVGIGLILFVLGILQLIRQHRQAIAEAAED